MKLIKNFKLIIIIIFFLISLISILKSFHDAQNLSFDFHFSPAKLVAEGINHYQYILDGKRDFGPNDKIMYAQNGNYAQGLFIILIPFTFLEWDNAKILWSIINIFISIFIPFLLSKKFNLNNFQNFVICSIFLTSTIFRIHIGYGQQTLIMFLFLVLPFVKLNSLNIILSGIAYFKYNIGYGLFLYFLSLRNFKNIFLSSIPLIIAWILYCLITKTNIFVNVFEPLRVILYWNSQQNHFPSTIFSILKYLEINSLILLILPIIICFILINHIKLIKDDLKKLSIICLSILSFAPHQLHDYVLLVPLLIYSFKNLQLITSKINILFIFYFFYFLRIISYIYGTQPWELPYGIFGYFNNLLTITVLIINIFFNQKLTSKKI